MPGGVPLARPKAGQGISPAPVHPALPTSAVRLVHPANQLRKAIAEQAGDAQGDIQPAAVAAG